MWGNRLGWMISLVIVLAYGGAMAWLTRGASAVSPPTEFAQAPRRGAPLTMPPGAAAAVPGMTEPCDAGPLYREAIALYRQDKALYDAFAADGRPGTPEAAKLSAVDKLVEATTCTGGTLFEDRPAELVGYSPSDDLHALRQLGRIAIARLGMTYKLAKNPKEATTYLQAGFALGRKLYQERLTYAEAELGLELMGDAAVPLLDLARQARDAGRVAELEDFDRARQQLVADEVMPMVRVLRSIDSRVVARHAGDVFHFADHAGERMWRVEAILALGRMRFFVGPDGRAGDQRAAVPRLRTYLDDPDAVIRAAAKAALDLTLERYRMLS